MDAITALALLTQLTTLTQSLAKLLQTAHAEGRPISAAELQSLRIGDDAADAMLVAAIERAKAEGR